MTRNNLIRFLLFALLLAACTPSAGQGESTAPPPSIVTVTAMPPTPIIVATATTAAGVTAESPTATPPAAATAVSVPVSATLVLELGNGLSLYTVPAVQSGSTPTYTLSTETPLLVGEDSLRVAVFNQEVANMVAEQAAGFLTGVQGLTQQFTDFGSSFNLTYRATGSSPDWLSLNFAITGYSDGAAHPYHYTVTYNYDLIGSRSLTLADLFLPGTAYLDRIANNAIQQMQLRPEFLFPDGAAATEENYRNWNITPEGLFITFDEYQVAPYAAGAQTVVIPYSELGDLINPAGPLAGLTG